MAVIVLHLDDFKTVINNRPKRCPHCDSELLSRWGKGVKIVQDANQESGEYHRYRCNNCQRTFRHYVIGIDRTHLSQRVRKLAGIAWMLGMSSRDVVEVLKESGIELNYMMVWREGKELELAIRNRNNPNYPGRLSIDKQFLKIKSRGIGTSVVVELSPGKSVVLGRTDIIDYRTILDWLEPSVKDLGIQISVMGTDRLFEMDVP